MLLEDCVRFLEKEIKKNGSSLLKADFLMETRSQGLHSTWENLSISLDTTTGEIWIARDDESAAPPVSASSLASALNTWNFDGAIGEVIFADWNTRERVVDKMPNRFDVKYRIPKSHKVGTLKLATKLRPVNSSYDADDVQLVERWIKIIKCISVLRHISLREERKRVSDAKYKELKTLAPLGAKAVRAAFETMYPHLTAQLDSTPTAADRGGVSGGRRRRRTRNSQRSRSRKSKKVRRRRRTLMRKKKKRGTRR